jgi:GT2 family glycosyltransferase
MGVIMKINLILPTYNNSNLTLKCLESIRRHEDLNYEVNIIWIDNNSDFEERKIVFDFLNNNNFKFNKIFLSKNLGFIKAVNIALKFILRFYPKNKFIGLINNDIEVSKDWLKNIIDSFTKDKNEEIQCIGSLCYDSNTNDLMKFDKDLNNEFLRLKKDDFSKYVNNFNSIIKSNASDLKTFSLIDFKDHKFSSTFVPYYAVIFRSSIFNKIGFLNEDFNLGYGDDTEFNYRICKAGYKIAKSLKSIVNHLGHSTFKLLFDDEEIIKIQESNRLQLKISKTLNSNKEKKYVIYTCISGNYDNLKPLTNVNTKIFDYICFTNSTNIIQKNTYPWKVINIKEIELGLNLQDENPKDRQVKFARFIKTHPHLFFENYEKSIWIDANIDVIGDANKYVDLLTNNHYILVPDHPYRNNIYEEISACIKLKKDDPLKLNYVNKFLLNENFPKNTYLTQTGVLVRDHNNEECRFLMERWWEMIRDFSRRDQLSFNYVFWKYNGKYLSLSWDLIKISYFITDYKHNEVS